MSPSAVAVAPKAADCTRIPGISQLMYWSDPAGVPVVIAPPKTKLKSNKNITGCTVENKSNCGMRMKRSTFRLVITAVCVTALRNGTRVFGLTSVVNFFPSDAMPPTPAGLCLLPCVRSV